MERTVTATAATDEKETLVAWALAAAAAPGARNSGDGGGGGGGRGEMKVYIVATSSFSSSFSYYWLALNRWNRGRVVVVVRTSQWADSWPEREREREDAQSRKSVTVNGDKEREDAAVDDEQVERAELISKQVAGRSVGQCAHCAGNRLLCVCLCARVQSIKRFAYPLTYSLTGPPPFLFSFHPSPPNGSLPQALHSSECTLKEWRRFTRRLYLLLYWQRQVAIVPLEITPCGRSGQLRLRSSSRERERVRSLASGPLSAGNYQLPNCLCCCRSTVPAVQCRVLVAPVDKNSSWKWLFNRWVTLAELGFVLMHRTTFNAAAFDLSATGICCDFFLMVSFSIIWSFLLFHRRTFTFISQRYSFPKFCVHCPECCKLHRLLTRKQVSFCFCCCCFCHHHHHSMSICAFEVYFWANQKTREKESLPQSLHLFALLLFSTHLHRFTPQLPEAAHHRRRSTQQKFSGGAQSLVALALVSRLRGRQTGSQLRCAVWLENKNTISVAHCWKFAFCLFFSCFLDLSLQ